MTAPTIADHAIEERIRIALSTWRTRLLDLSKRNRALNFRPAKVSTVAIVDEQPVEVYRHLVLEARPMRFRPMLPSVTRDGREENLASNGAESSVQLPADAGVAGVDDSAEVEALELDFAPYDPASLEDRHRDDILQAQSTPEALDKSLRRLDEQARGTLEEQGVNVLFLALGMLHYTESRESTVVLKAPILLVPVSLSRRSARSGFTIHATDEEPIVNPALGEHLKRNLGVQLPELPAFEEGDEIAQLAAFYQALSEIAADRVKAGLAGWAVKTDIFLGLFAFQKLVMFKDLEANAEPFGSHRLTRRLLSRDGENGFDGLGLPEEIRRLDLDDVFPPERTAQVVDADSSQLRAIVAVSRNHDLVLEGPPGTGKSQTITNLIAQALHDGKSVLFVAEKMAALQVVQQRLVRAGLGEFCLELHATKANKREVMHDLRAALDASLQTPEVPQKTRRLPHVRGELTQYARAVHTPHGTLGITPYRAYGMLEQVLGAPRIPLKRAVEDLTLQGLEDTEGLLDDLAAAQPGVGTPWTHPWRMSERVFYVPSALDGIKASIENLLQLHEEVLHKIAVVQAELRLPSIETAADVTTAEAIAAVFEQSPGASLSVLQSSAWDSPPAEATQLIDAGRKLSTERGQLESKFVEAALEVDHAGDIAYVEHKTSGILGFLAFLDGRFRAVRRRWMTYRRSEFAPALLELADELKAVDRYRSAQRDLASRFLIGQALFGQLWQGEGSNWSALQQYVAWVVQMRGLCVRHGLESDALRVATSARPNVTAVRELVRAAAALVQPLAELRVAIKWPDDYLAQDAFRAVRDRLEGMQASIEGIHSWTAFEQARQKVAGSPASELAELAMDGDKAVVRFAELRPAFRRAVLERWLEAVMEERPVLQEFKTMRHEQRLAEFRSLDEQILRENQARVVARMRASAQQRLQSDAARAGLPFLQREMAKQRHIAPLRKLLQHAEATVRAIKPCFLMSPLTVAQYLSGKVPSFDLVIFDEASQLPSEDAIGAICRGKQLVVVGDPKQLPPTNFFASSIGATESPLGEDGLPLVEDTESVLEEFMGAGVPKTRLKWHYRSAHESLITFSNVSFYDADLYTFPSVETGSDTYGLSFEYVENGVYEGKGLNHSEARRVVDAVVRHAKERPHESLGVGTFNLRQQLAILDELELRRRQDPSIESFFSRSNTEPFFVKNLENIQGDERDVIFLSVTYAKGPDGRLRYNFGPINGENGWRRLNVLTTRARKRMRVYSSMRGDEINAAGTTSRGAHLMREFLLFAEHGRLQSQLANAAAATESLFEAQVASELLRRGIKVVPQVGVAGYRIDLGVQDDDLPGRFVCGIECDGVAYHSSETARDRDRLRQQVLEARGWIIHRVWSTDWFTDRSGQIVRLMSLIGAARQEVAIRMKAEAEAAAQARELAVIERREAAERQAREEENRVAAIAVAMAAGPYQRPVAKPYQFASGSTRSGDLVESPLSHVAAAVQDVVGVESPVHEDDIATRVAGLWGAARVGSRIAAKIEEAIDSSVRSGRVQRRGAFLWLTRYVPPVGTVPVRSRAGTKISGDRVAPEEIAEAITLVLKAAGGMTREELLSEARQVLGVTKGSLAEAFALVVEQGLRDGRWGEGSSGLALRN